MAEGKRLLQKELVAARHGTQSKVAGFVKFPFYGTIGGLSKRLSTSACRRARFPVYGTIGGKSCDIEQS
jgi:hypothetical protein